LKLYFKNSQGKERLIAECETAKDVSREIHKFLDDHNYRSHYSRSWGNEENIMIDVGSHSEFFIVKGIAYGEYIKGLEQGEEPEEKIIK
jgi:hypothetical protein